MTDPQGYDPREHFCPPLEDGAARLRRTNLAHAVDVVTRQPPAPWLPCTHDWPYSAQLPHVNPEDCE